MSKNKEDSFTKCQNIDWSVISGYYGNKRSVFQQLFGMNIVSLDTGVYVAMVTMSYMVSRVGCHSYL